MPKIPPKYVKSYIAKRCDSSLYETMDLFLNFTRPEIIVVIPSYKEDYDVLIKTLNALFACKTAIPYEVYVLVNYKDDDSTEVKEASEKLYRTLASRKDLDQLFVFIKELKGKHKGVGLARKHLMDTAFLRFQNFDHNGIIVNLDADTVVEANYFDAIVEFFKTKPSIDAASIHVEHILDNVAIINYELHLRYFINMQRLAGLAYAYQTVGSAMAVRALAYAKEGGMNLRQAGEDFYFIHKYSTKMTLGEINTTKVMPSGRESDRVPFGTGKAIADFYKAEQTEMMTYNPIGFLELSYWIKLVENTLLTLKDPSPVNPTYKLLEDYLESISYEKNWKRILDSTTSRELRIVNFYAWFNAFQLMKYLHYIRSHGVEDSALSVAVKSLFDHHKVEYESNEKALMMLRKMDRQTDYKSQWSAALISKLSKTTAS